MGSSVHAKGGVDGLRDTDEERPEDHSLDPEDRQALCDDDDDDDDDEDDDDDDDDEDDEDEDEDEDDDDDDDEDEVEEVEEEGPRLTLGRLDRVMGRKMLRGRVCLRDVSHAQGWTTDTGAYNKHREHG